jgi:outer membrane protein assembly factor BamD (BamD/ComL family)
MQLGRAYVRAGKKEEAVRAFNRIVEEFPQSVYVSDARRELEEARKTS